MAASIQLRKWQTEALEKFEKTNRKDFLAVATPGAGKTTFALSAAFKLLQSKEVTQVVVVAPTEHLKKQWADAAGRFGIKLDPYWSNSSKLMRAYHGIVVTYAQVSLGAERHALGVKAKDTFVILDEVHHAGDSLSWGDGVKTAFKHAKKRLMLSGSPWRSDVNPIPFVSYNPGSDGILRSQADYTYGYSDALKDDVVRPIMFLAYSGKARWRGSDGEDLEATLESQIDKTTTARALRSALHPESDWVASVLSNADDKLNQVRRQYPDAGGLVLASNKTHARAYAKRLEAYCGEKVAVAVSEDPNAGKVIEDYAKGRDKWLVAVRMVSEGVDIPRLAVGVYATNASTSLFFTQAIGRYVRARQKGESATLFIPAVPGLLKLSSEIERERDHALKAKQEASEEELMRRANSSERALERYEFQALGSSAHFERVIVNGAEFGPQEHTREVAESHVLTLDALETLDMSALIGGEEVPLHRQVKEARQILAKEVASYSLMNAISHAQVHTHLRQVCGGPSVSEASLDEIWARINHLRYPYKLKPSEEDVDEGPTQMSLF